MRITSRILFSVFVLVGVLGFCLLGCIDDTGSWMSGALIAAGIMIVGIIGALVTYDIYTSIGVVCGCWIIFKAMLYRYIIRRYNSDGVGHEEYCIVCRCGSFRSTIDTATSCYKRYKGV